jgi:HEAT repeat protein
LEHLENEPSGLSRGYIAEYLRYFPGHTEVQERLIHLFSTDPEPWVRARAMRAYEAVGDEKGIRPLRKLFMDMNRTRWGMVGEIAREVHDALVQCPELP